MDDNIKKEYWVYGITISPLHGRKYDERFNIYVFDGRHILSEDTTMRFFSFKELDYHQIMERFKGTDGITGVIREGSLIYV